MSVGEILLTPGLQSWLYNNFGVEDQFLKNLRKDSIEEAMPEINISPLQANVLQFLIKLMNANNVVEIGSLGGYSAVSMASALSDGGRLTAVEYNEEYAWFIIKKVRAAGLEEKIKVVNRSGIDFLKEYSGPDFDFVFLDADKKEYMDYFNLARNHLTAGGVIIADNAFAYGRLAEDVPDRMVEVNAIREYNKYVLKQKEFTHTFLPVGDGMLLSMKEKKSEK